LPDNKFGMLMKYPSLDPKRDWYLSDNPNNDSRITRKAQISDGKVCGNATDGFYWCGDNGQIRIHVAPYVGKDDSKCACDQGNILTRGYMETDKDWRNVEISGEMRLKGAGDSLTIYARGEYHYSKSSSADCNSCKGSSVKVNINLGDQTVPEIRFAFETWHVNYNHTIYYPIPAEVLAGYQGGILYDQWFRFIYCIYNIDNNSKVVNELYLSKGLTNDFVLIKKITVPGGVQWADGYNGAKACGCPTDTTPILWGGPIASYRWDDMDDDKAVSWRKLAIREIDVTKTFGSTGEPTPGGTAGTVAVRFTDLFNIGTRTFGDSCTGVPLGIAEFVPVYSVTTSTAESSLSDDAAPIHKNRTRIMQRVKNTDSVLFGVKPRKVEVQLKKVASPGGNCKCAIWDKDGNEVVSLGELGVNSFSTDYSTTQTFYNEEAPNSLPDGIKDEWFIGFEYLGTSSNDYIMARYDGNNPIDGSNSIYSHVEADVPAEFTNRDLRMIVYI
jgi:hypothetical protein